MLPLHVIYSAKHTVDIHTHRHRLALIYMNTEYFSCRRNTIFAKQRLVFCSEETEKKKRVICFSLDNELKVTQLLNRTAVIEWQLNQDGGL